jgi:hypothetical protein
MQSTLSPVSEPKPTPVKINRSKKDTDVPKFREYDIKELMAWKPPVLPDEEKAEKKLSKKSKKLMETLM